MDIYLLLIQKLALALEENNFGALADFRRTIKEEAADQAAILEVALYHKGDADNGKK